MAKPRKWHELYPCGTKEGDDEIKLFRALARNKSSYRSTAAIVKASGLTKQRVEEIVDKYATQIEPPLIYPHPENEDHWGYWECIEFEEKDKRSISQKDIDRRIQKHLNGSNKSVEDDEKSSL